MHFVLIIDYTIIFKNYNKILVTLELSLISKSTHNLPIQTLQEKSSQLFILTLQ